MKWGKVLLAALLVGGGLVIYGAVNQKPDFSSNLDSSSIPVRITDVASCSVDTPGWAKAKIQVHAVDDASYVSFGGDFTDETHTVIGQGIANLSTVVAGQDYQTEMLYQLSRNNPQDGTCEAHVSNWG